MRSVHILPASFLIIIAFSTTALSQPTGSVTTSPPPVVRAVDVTVDVAEEYGVRNPKAITWRDDGVTSTLRFEFAPGQRVTEEVKPYHLAVVRSGDTPRTIPLFGFPEEEVNGWMLNAGAPSAQTIPLGIKRKFEHPLCRVWETERWRVYRVIWLVGGASGPPPVPMVVVALDRLSGRWAVWGKGLDQHAADGGDVQSIEALDGNRVQVWWWTWWSTSVMERRSWVIESRPDGPHRSDGPPRFMFWTWSGFPSTFADTPRAAKHLGQLEVAWRVATTMAAGGVAVARGDSVRRPDPDPENDLGRRPASPDERRASRVRVAAARLGGAGRQTSALGPTNGSTPTRSRGRVGCRCLPARERGTR